MSTKLYDLTSSLLSFLLCVSTISSKICLTLNYTEITYSNNVEYVEVRIDPQLNFQEI